MSNSLLLLTGACALVMLAAVDPAYAQDKIDGEVFNDPTRPILPAARPRGEPVPAAQVAKKLFAVGFVRASGKFPIAIVNGVQVSVGSFVDGAEVVAITATGVELQIEGERQVVAAFGSVVKTFEQ